VSLLGDCVVDEGVGGHFVAAVAAGPGFGGGEQSASDAPTTVGRIDIPAFEVADGVGGVAAVSMGAEGNLGKADELAVGGLGDEVGHGEGGGSAAAEERGEIAGVLGEGGVGPKGVEERGEAVEVGGSCGANHRSRVQGAACRAQGTRCCGSQPSRSTVLAVTAGAAGSC